MKSVEASAKTRQDAIQKALDMLGAELHEVQIEILDEGSRGIFGLGARDVKVRLTLEAGPEPETRPSTKEEERPRAERRPEGPPRRERTPRPERSPRREEPPRGERRADRADARPAEKPREPELPAISDSRREEATALLAEVIEKMGIKATVTSAPTKDGGARLDVESEDSAILIGRKGRDLQALQYLINRMMRSADAPETVERFSVDVERYVERRKAGLEEMALQLADRAKNTGNEVRVKPLNPQERRIVHLALQDDPDVRTFSLGNTLMRTIVISPRTSGRDQRRSRRPRGRGGQRDERRPGYRPSARPPARRTPERPDAVEDPQGDTGES